jgi:hypothetical protein
VVDHREDEATADRASADEHRGAVAKREVIVLDSGLTEREDGALEQSDAANLSQGLRAAFETEAGSRGEDHARGHLERAPGHSAGLLRFTWPTYESPPGVRFAARR